MKTKYLIRLDDACPTMNRAKWHRMFDILDAYGIKPMIGIIPHNEDETQNIDSPDPYFWQEAKQWEQKGYAIALHGYNHCYISNKGLKGMNPIWMKSEFSGVDLEKQKYKIREGYQIMKHHGLSPKYFFAPSHTFDKNTLQALKDCSDIRIISDTIATKPYKRYGFVFIPQIGGEFKEIKFMVEIRTFCLHPNTMSDEKFREFDAFLQNHRNEFIGFDELDLSSVSRTNITSQILSLVYFVYRRIRGLK